MKKYMVNKTIMAKPMNRADYNSLRGWAVPDDENPLDDGYLVEDPGFNKNNEHFEGYISWTPKDMFERTHEEIDPLFKINVDDMIKAGPGIDESKTKSLGNTDANGATKNVKDIAFFGNGDLFELIAKASSKNEGWMKSTKAMEIEGVGCVVQVTTQQNDHVAEALTFVPGVRIDRVLVEGKITRSLVAIQ